MAVGLSSSLYSVHACTCDGSNTLYGPAVKFQTGLHNCRLQASICTGPQTKGVGVTNVPWDHLSGPQTYINDVECNK